MGGVTPRDCLGTPVLRGDGFFVSPLEGVSDRLAAEMSSLYALLDPALPPLRREQVERAVADPGVTVYAAVTGDRIAGLATLLVVPTIARTRVWAEDLVVHPGFRRMGIGRALMDVCADAAAKLGVPVVEGTVHPERTAAVELYRRTGWQFGPSVAVRRQVEINR
jgi:ribosomal protein S18 acetylase RimI-like enzyme